MEESPHVESSNLTRTTPQTEPNQRKETGAESNLAMNDAELARKLDTYSLESIVELKISRFLDQIGTYYPEDLHSIIMRKAEKPLLNQILRRTGGNQVHAARILGINRNTLRKKMKMYGFY